MSKPGKQTVDLATSGGAAPRVSRIRRDPASVAAAPAKKKAVTYRDEDEKRSVLIGIAFFSIALFIILLQFSDFTNDYFN